MTSIRFDPAASPATYATCDICELVLKTEADAQAHMDITFKESKTRGELYAHGHRIKVLNPSRTDRIRNHFSNLIAEATEALAENADRLIEKDDVTVEEVTDALSGHPDFADAWSDFCDGQEL